MGKGGGAKGAGGKGKGWGNQAGGVWQMQWVKVPVQDKGKGKGKGYGYKGKGNSAPAVPKGFSVPPTKRFTGTVATYYKLQGYGFISLDQKGVLDGDKVFVHWQAIKSSDRFPSLAREMEVQFNLEKTDKSGKQTVNATNVELKGGGEVAVQDEADSKKTFVGGQELRYTGTLKFFIPKRGYGYITIDDGFEYGGEDVPKDIRVEMAEMNAGSGGKADYCKDVKVEFGIWKTQKGAFKAYNCTKTGGTPFEST